MPRTTVLHVDDDPVWLKSVKDALSDVPVDLIQVASLGEAKNAVGGADVVICDGSIHEENDGHNWARELHEAGIKVIVLSMGQGYPEVPFVAKLYFKEKLIEFVQGQR